MSQNTDLNKRHRTNKKYACSLTLSIRHHFSKRFSCISFTCFIMLCMHIQDQIQNFHNINTKNAIFDLGSVFSHALFG